MSIGVKKKRSGDGKNHHSEQLGESVKAIQDEINLDIPGMTDLMKAAYDVDSETVALAIMMGQDRTAVDSKNNDATRYLFAGYNAKMCYFRQMHPGSELINRDKMTPEDRQRYDSLTEELVKIIDLLNPT